jgi:hypothetical protein
MTKCNGKIIRKKSKAKISISERNQKKMYDNQKMTKCNDKIIRKQSKAKV